MDRSIVLRNEKGLSKQELLICISLVVGVFVIIALVVFVPGVKVVPGSSTSIFHLSRASNSHSSSDDEDEDSVRGVFELGDIQLSLSNKEEYIDSSISLEYDCGVLSISTKGKIHQEGAAADYFRNKEPQIKSAIVAVASGYSSKQIGKSDGIDNFRDDLMIAINKTFSKSRKKQPITNVYFEHFTFFSPDRETS